MAGFWDNFTNWLGSEEGRRAQIQFGLSLMQPIQPGQNWVSHMANAVWQASMANQRAKEWFAKQEDRKLQNEYRRQQLELQRANLERLRATMPDTEYLKQSRALDLKLKKLKTSQAERQMQTYDQNYVKSKRKLELEAQRANIERIRASIPDEEYKRRMREIDLRVKMLNAENAEKKSKEYDPNYIREKRMLEIEAQRALIEQRKAAAAAKRTGGTTKLKPIIPFSEYYKALQQSMIGGEVPLQDAYAQWYQEQIKLGYTPQQLAAMNAPPPPSLRQQAQTDGQGNAAASRQQQLRQPAQQQSMVSPDTVVNKLAQRIMSDPNLNVSTALKQVEQRLGKGVADAVRRRLQEMQGQ